MSQELIEFLKIHYNIPAYLVGLTFAIIYYRKYFDTALKYFPILIAYTFFNELLGYFIRYTDGFAFFSREEYLNANDIIYNIYALVFFGFFYYTYWKISVKFKRHIRIVSILAFLSFVVSVFFQNPFLISLYYAFCICAWTLFYFTVLYFLELRPNLNWSSQKNNLMFWVSGGLGIFYFFFPIIFLTGFLNYELWLKLELRTVLRVLIILMYAFFCIGFLLGRRKHFR